MSQSSKVTSSSKMKKSTKDREKRKSIPGNLDNNCNSNVSEKSSPTSDSFSKRYAGLSSENIKAFAEHVTFPTLLSEELCEVLAEDLNYKLRYIIQEAANRALVSNRTAINSEDIEETFIDLSIDKVYGAPSNPVWIPFGDQNYLYLDDPKVDIIEEAEAELAFIQPGDPIIEKTWLPEFSGSNQPLVNYFRTISDAIISNDIDLRKMALQNISANPNIGPIIEWFYKLGYMLLSKDITYDSLTLYALDLLETLEMCPLGNAAVSENQLKLLVRLILQRLLKSFTNPSVLKPMCWVLAILCRRYPLREFVMAKLTQKLPELFVQFSLPLIMILNSLGIDAITTIFVNNIEYFLSTLQDNWQSFYGYCIMVS
ncbi:hypothetical protein HHI36_013508 [Cryptolaemus montrouzieri]|uniref:Transcription initiation factor TFIID subunit 6 n=1 Tax=Cryptolaemus montrouzieri TaxID=559131 RepID=A0ABD2NHI0_9CUCU